MKKRDLRLKEYNIGRNRYRELLYFSLQYKEYKGISGKKKRRLIEEAVRASVEAVYRGSRTEDMRECLLKGVTREDITYEYLYMRLNVPCSRDMYWKMKRKYFSLLDKSRG